MEITRSSIDTAKGPADWFIGDVYIDALAAPAGSSTFAPALVHFTLGARTAWHTHLRGQTIYVTEGVGLCQCEDGPVEVIRPGDRVFVAPGAVARRRFRLAGSKGDHVETARGRRGSPRLWHRRCSIGQSGSRSIGHDMHRGPPRPRPSSAPAIVITSIPAWRSRVFVSTLRS